MSYMPEYELFSDLDSIYNLGEQSVNDNFKNFPDNGILNFSDSFDLPDIFAPAKSDGNSQELFKLKYNFSQDQFLPDISPLSPSLLKYPFDLKSSEEDSSDFDFNLSSRSSNTGVKSPKIKQIYENNFDPIDEYSYENKITDSESSINLKPEISPLLPVKIVVKRIDKASVKEKVSSKMVAPFNTPNVGFSLVKIPSGNGSHRITFLKKGGKLSPIHPTTSDQTMVTETSVLPIEPKILTASFTDTLPIEPEISTASSTDTTDSLNQTDNEQSQVIEKVSDTKKTRKLKLRELPFTSLKRKLPLNKSRRSRKLIKAYELDPLADPVMEKCRRNAINAKKNREIKKIRMMELEEEVKTERDEKLRLAGENENLKHVNESLAEKLKSLSDVLQDPCKLSSLLEKVIHSKMNCQGLDTSENILNASCLLDMGRQTT